MGVDALELAGPEGVVVRQEAAGSRASTIETKIRAAGSMWLCAVARGTRHSTSLGPVVFAHTSPVYVDVEGRPTASVRSARWLVDWLDRLEEMLRTHGQFDDDSQRDDLLALIERARAYYRALTP
jgi:hypothetical protein